MADKTLLETYKPPKHKNNMKITLAWAVILMAADGGAQKAAEVIPLLESKMTPAQLTQARKTAAQLRQRNRQ